MISDIKPKILGLKKGQGITTGTCAQAAVKGACAMLSKRKLIKKINIETPKRIKLTIPLIDQKINKNFVTCAVIKNSGDDPDITNGIRIYAKVKRTNKNGLIIRGGKGVGRVTLPGLAVQKGGWAINPIPKKMITQEVLKFFPNTPAQRRGVEATISIPAGKKLAYNTFNPRLGIIGGISIIGTTGIVEPKSLNAYKKTLTIQLDVLKARGNKKVVLVLGYVGEKFCKNTLKIKENKIVKIGDHVGFMLKECARKGFKDILLAGHLGKLIKLTKNQFNTHCDFGDNRIQPIIRFAQSCGADAKIIKQLYSQKTAEAAIPILKKANLSEIFAIIAKDVTAKCVKLTKNKFSLKIILLSLTGELLAITGDKKI